MKKVYVWVARDLRDDEACCAYSLFSSRPVRSAAGRWDQRCGCTVLAYGLCPAEFHRLMSVKLAPGTCKRFEWVGSPLRNVPVKKAPKKKAK